MNLKLFCILITCYKWRYSKYYWQIYNFDWSKIFNAVFVRISFSPVDFNTFTSLLDIYLIQCAEKVLKALHFNKDSNNVPGSNDLVTLTSGLPSEIGGMVRNLVTVVGPRDRLMYPDRLSVDKIPADDFTKEIAERAKDVTRRILEFGVDML